MPAAPRAVSAWRSEPWRGERPAAVTARFRFPKRSHLRKTDEISSVFDFRRRAAGFFLTVHMKPNALGHARLAVMVPRRVAARAVDRNYMRRVVREVFRQAQHTLGACDLVVRVSRGFGREDFSRVREELLQHLSRLCPCPSSSSPSSAPISS